MFKLRIITIENVVADLDVSKLMVTTPQGQTGILSGHIPLLTAINPGEVRYDTKDKEVKLVVTSGSLEVKDNLATLLVDEAIPIDEVDLSMAETERKRLLNILDDSKVPLYELEETRRELKNVMAKIKVVGKDTKD